MKATSPVNVAIMKGVTLFLYQMVTVDLHHVQKIVLRKHQSETDFSLLLSS